MQRNRAGQLLSCTDCRPRPVIQPSLFFQPFICVTLKIPVLMVAVITHQWSLSQPPASVWQYLTDPDLLSVWLMPNDFRAEVGHEFTFRTHPLPQRSPDGIFHCRVLEILPEKSLVYSWQGGPQDGKVTLDTTVTWTLEETPAGTDLLLVHSGFYDENQAIQIEMTKGWLYYMNRLIPVLQNNGHGSTGK
jgi:uncharacterized protein YndB with AHSA1/START domain